MGKGATIHVRDKNGVERWVTPLAFSLVSKGFYVEILDDGEKPTEQPAKKKEDVKNVVKEEDFKVVTLYDEVVDKEEIEEVFSDIDDIQELREEYLKLSGEEKVDKRWKEDRLKEEIEKLK